MQPNILKELEELRKRNAALEAMNEALQKRNEALLADIENTANELQIGTEQFRLMADNIPVIMWMANADGNVDYFNKRWHEYTGQNPENAKGWGWQPVLHPEDLQHTFDTWNNSLLTGLPYKIEYRFKRAADNTYRWHLGKGLPFRDKDGNVLKWFGTCTDIHEQKEAENKKDVFISIASHELKTPLTTVKAFVNLAKDIMQPGTVAYDFIGKAAVQLNRLEKLISDLLDVSKINAGKMNYDVEEFDFTAALQETINNVQQTAAQHRIVLEANAGVVYKGDKLRLEQVMNNLLTNAIKYSPRADKVIVRSEVAQNNIIVSVQDFGIGIAAENLKNLFNRYYRVDNTATRFQGLGLGLFISSEIIKRHNGSFWIESEPEKGSVFYFLLPLNGQDPLTEFDTDNRTFYKSSFIHIQYNSNRKWLEADWMGYQNFDSVKKGCFIMLDLLKKNHCKEILNDNTLVAGNWSEAADWVGETFFPMLIAAGLQQIAWIYSPSTFSKLSADKSVNLIDNQLIHFFSNKKEATDWLDLIKFQCY